MIIHLPQGCGVLSGTVVRRGRSLYGLKQASRTWHQYLVRGMKCLGFEQCAADARLMRLMKKAAIAMVVIVTVDGIFSIELNSRCVRFCRNLNEYVPISNLGELRLYAGIQFFSRDLAFGDGYTFSAGFYGKLGRKVWCLPQQRDPHGNLSEA